MHLTLKDPEKMDICTAFSKEFHFSKTAKMHISKVYQQGDITSGNLSAEEHVLHFVHIHVN